MKLGLFQPKAVQGLYAFAHYEAPNGAWVQLPVGRGPISRRAPAVFSYGADDVRPHERFDSFAALQAFVEGLPD